MAGDTHDFIRTAGLAEERAKADFKGLWGNCTITEEKGRKQTNPAE